jgi:peptide/nickel transport system ATP-binding protein/oligopeptide transport system ATP-binding protein
MALLFITHDLAVAKSFCDYLYVMHHGKIVEEGDAKSVLLNPHDSYTQKLISAVPKVPAGWIYVT